MVRLLLTLILLGPTVSLSDELQGFVGSWAIEADTSSSDFPWWKEVKYPRLLHVSRTDSGLSLRFEDQYGFECTISNPLVTNEGRDLVFSHCGPSKFENAWSPIQHAKIDGDKIRGVVTAEKFLFRWAGVRLQ